MQRWLCSSLSCSTTLEDATLRPPGFDLTTYWEEASSSFVERLPRYQVVARVSPALLARLEHHDRNLAVRRLAPADEHGWTVVSLRLETFESAGEYLLGLGPQVEVLEPPELRERVRQQAAAVSAAYEQTPG